ncbi:MAG: hypothetical protein JOY55_03270 [Mycobacterium sp.]|jgi:hypothetical protein|nr:hypothetical protein [Mycobacterium sp.]MBV8290836.1 hypothetical protein [Mycobacterium sp.]
MGHVNYWLVAVAFLLGLLLTFALTVRRVKREVPVRSSAAAAAAVAAPVKSPSEAETTKIKAAAGSPYGAGSARPGADGSGPEGWLVKGNEDSMLYHTPDSPHYTQTIAEVWFKDEESAEQGGFTSWRKGRNKE